MTNSNDALRAALEQCMKQFAFYAVEHAKAGKVEKAATNQKFADLCHNALALTPSPVAGGDLREALLEARGGFEAANLLIAALSGNQQSAMVETFIERIDAALNQPAAPVEAVEAVDDWSEKQKELFQWTGSAFLNGEKVENEAECKSQLYTFLCGLVGYLEPSEPAASTVAQGDEIAALKAEIVDLKSSVIAFCAPWSATYARDFGLPDGTIHATHYDILEKAGARMDDFVRHEPATHHKGSSDGQ